MIEIYVSKAMINQVKGVLHKEFWCSSSLPGVDMRVVSHNSDCPGNRRRGLHRTSEAGKLWIAKKETYETRKKKSDRDH